jgi:hypothetical protein
LTRSASARSSTSTACPRAPGPAAPWACNETLESFDPRGVQAARLYEEQLIIRGETDFEAMVTRAVRTVRENEHVRDILRARFPHLIVDEYQDLGGVLHERGCGVRPAVVLCMGELSGRGRRQRFERWHCRRKRHQAFSVVVQSTGHEGNHCR